MPKTLLEMDASDGTLLVAVDAPQAAVRHVARDGDWPIQKIDKTFDAVKEVVLRGCRPLTEAFSVLNQDFAAESAELEFGISFTAKGSVYLVESSGEAALKIKVNWNFRSHQD